MVQVDRPVKGGGQGGYWYPGTHTNEDVDIQAGTEAMPITVLELGDKVVSYMERVCSVDVFVDGDSKMLVQGSNDTSPNTTRWVSIFYDGGDPQIFDVTSDNPARFHVPDTARARLRILMWPSTAMAEVSVSAYCRQRRV